MWNIWLVRAVIRPLKSLNVLTFLLKGASIKGNQLGLIFRLVRYDGYGI